MNVGRNLMYKGFIDLVLYHEPTNKFYIYDIKYIGKLFVTFVIIISFSLITKLIFFTASLLPYDLERFITSTEFCIKILKLLIIYRL